MAKVIGKAPPPRGNRNRKKKKLEKLREIAFKEIAKENPSFVDTEQKRNSLRKMIQKTEFAVDENGELKMFYNGEEIK